MSGKSEGTGLLNDKGELVKKIEAKIKEAEKRLMDTALRLSLTPNIGDLINYQNDKGEVVREIKAENGDVIVKYILHGWLNGPPNHHVLTPPVDYLTNYQNDNMGAPTEDPRIRGIQSKPVWPFEREVVTGPLLGLKKAKVVKFKRGK